MYRYASHPGFFDSWNPVKNSIYGEVAEWLKALPC